MGEDGAIDLFEFICALAFLTKKPVAERLGSIFRIIDPEETHSCELLEFKSLILVILKIARGVEGSTGESTERELNNKIEKIMENRIDQQSKYLTLDEFCNIIKTDKDLIRSLKKIGIFGKPELQLQARDNDLQLELKKFECIEENINDQKQKTQSMQTANENIQDTSGLLGIIGNELEIIGLNYDTCTSYDKSSKPDSFKPGPEDSSEPNIDFTLEYVYGYRCHDVRNNIFFNPDDKIIFHSSQVGIQLDYQAKQQKFIMQETHEIVCMDTHGCWTATGEITEFPVVSIWDNQSMQIHGSFSGTMSQGISDVKFSNDGLKLAVATLDHFRTILILDVKKLVIGEREGKLF